MRRLRRTVPAARHQDHIWRLRVRGVHVWGWGIKGKEGNTADAATTQDGACRQQAVSAATNRPNGRESLKQGDKASHGRNGPAQPQQSESHS
jgi:hypothetical protein